MAWSIIAGPNKHNIAVLVPAYPLECSTFRVVCLNESRDKFKELICWVADEWQAEDEDLSCIGAIAGAIKQVNDGKAFSAKVASRSALEWESL